MEEMGIRKAARALVDLSTDFGQDEDWILEIRACEDVARDPTCDRLRDVSSGFSFSFRYGGTYLSASRETAASYALLYREGGEALTQCLKLLRRLSEARPGIASREEFAPLVEFTAIPATALVVEARDIEVSALRTEQGDGLEYLLGRIEDALEDPEFYDCLVGQHNFELTQPVPLNQLRFQTVRKFRKYDEIGASREALEFLPFGES